MTEPTDTELVEAYLDKKQDGALTQLIRRHQIPVFRHLSHELADPDDAEQVCETVFVVASRRLEEWPQQGDFRGWLMELADEVGDSRRGEAIADDSARLVDPAVFFQQSVHQALQTLAPDERALLVAVELEGQTAEEVAEKQDRPVEQVTEALEQARARFTETLARPSTEPDNDDDDDDDGQTEQPIVTVQPGKIVDNRYRVEELLGEGGMATVFAAQHVAIKRRVALKTLHPNRQTQSMIHERFVREAEVLGKLTHPNFVDVSDFGESSEGFSYLVMELLDGRPLSDELEAVGKMGPHRAFRIIRQVVLSLAFAHQQGIVHRDIKPDNVVLLDDESGEGFAKILDLGIATTEDDDHKDEPALFGTPAYMAPEQIQGDRLDGRVDIYAVGIMLFELLTGELPFLANNVQYLLVLHLTEAVPRLGSVVEERVVEEEELQKLIDRCLAKKPQDRFPSASALLEEIERVLETLDAEPLPQRMSLREQKRSTKPAPALESKKRRSSLVLIAFAILVVIGAWWLWGRA